MNTFTGGPTTNSQSSRHVVIAAITFGDPSHVVDMPWDLGKSKKNGIFPRQNTSGCEPYSDVIGAWCDDNDLFCDSGNSLPVHRSYFFNYTQAAASFIVSKYNASLSTGTSPTSTPVPSTTPTIVPSGGGAGPRPMVFTAVSALAAALLCGVVV